MKSNLIYLVSLMLFTACSMNFGETRIPASMRSASDIGVIAKNGRRLLFYAEEDRIVIKSCERSYYFTNNASKSRRQCMGRKNSIPREYFKSMFKTAVTSESLKELHPLSFEEIESYEGKKDDLFKRIDGYVEELRNMALSQRRDGKASIDLHRQSKIKSFLKRKASDSLISAIQKVNRETDLILDMIFDEDKLTRISFQQHQGTLLYTLLTKFDPEQIYPCGLEGSIEERIKDCSRQVNAGGRNFPLVTRGENFEEAYLDQKTQLIWLSRFPGTYERFSTAKLETKHCPQLARKLRLEKIKWSIPSREHFVAAAANGLLEKTRDSLGIYWTKQLDTPAPYYETYAYNAFTGEVKYFDDKTHLLVRCIGEL